MNGPITLSGTMNGAPFNCIATFPPQPTQFMPTAPPSQCFLCARHKNWKPAVTVYHGTYLCAECVQSLPDGLIIDEFPPTDL